VTPNLHDDDATSPDRINNDEAGEGELPSKKGMDVVAGLFPSSRLVATNRAVSGRSPDRRLSRANDSR
jgi:hypothetical protein